MFSKVSTHLFIANTIEEVQGDNFRNEIPIIKLKKLILTCEHRPQNAAKQLIAA